MLNQGRMPTPEELEATHEHADRCERIVSLVRMAETWATDEEFERLEAQLRDLVGGSLARGKPRHRLYGFIGR